MSSAEWVMRVPAGSSAGALLVRGATGLSLDLGAEVTASSLRALLSGLPCGRVPLWLNAGLAGPALLWAACPECARWTGWWELEAAQPLAVLGALRSEWSRIAPGLADISLTLSALREQGISGALELACLLEAAQEHPVAGIGWSVSVQLLEEIARLRLARRLLPSAAHHGRSLARDLTAGQRDVNLVRVAYQTLAAALGGLDSFLALSRDHWLAVEEPESLLLALRSQQVIAAESALERQRDPMAGSEAVLAITREMERDVAAFRARLEAAGGWSVALQSGLVSRLAKDHAVERPRMGVDRFVREEPGLARRLPPEGVSFPVPEIVAAPKERLFDSLAASAREDVPLGRLNASLAAR